eukprot:9794682-Alexandrium_andersonii.AAC.1
MLPVFWQLRDGAGPLQELHIMDASDDLDDWLVPAGREGGWSMGPPAGLFHDDPADVWDD